MTQQRHYEQMGIIQALRLAILAVDDVADRNAPPPGRGGQTSIQREMFQARRQLVRLERGIKRASLANKFFNGK